MDGLRILKENCFRCHGEDKRKGGLVLTSREMALKGGDEGKVIDLEKPEESQILKLILENADPHICLLYTSPSPRDRQKSRMPSSA